MAEPPDRERELIARAQAGDPAAFADLMTAYSELIYRIPFGILGNGEEAKDAQQEATIDAWLGLGGYDPTRPFRPWLARIAANRARKAWNKRNGRRELPLYAEETLGRLTDRADVVVERELERIENIDRDRAMLRAYERLAPEDREILILKGVHALPEQEIARRLGIAVGTVKSRFSRAKSRLKGVWVAERLEW
jgi:RNA polymerase sigma-70 factor (ECF subfamily)